MNETDNQEQQNNYGIHDAALDLQNMRNGISNFKNGNLSSMTNKSPENLGKEAGKEAAKEAGKEAAKEAGKEVAKEGAKTAAEAGAASTGVGAIPVVAERAATLGVETLEKTAETLSGSKIKFSDIVLAIVGILLFVYLAIAAGAIHGNIGASSEKYQEDQSHNSRAQKGIMGLVGSLLFKFFDTDDEMGEYQSQYPLNEALSKNVSIIDKGFDKAYEIAEMECINVIIKEQYDYDLTMESFYSNGDPYEEINYAELISIISESETYNIENIKFSTFKNLFKASLSNENLKYLYCMKIEEDYKKVKIHVYPTGIEKRLSADETPPDDTDEGGYTYEKEIRYGKVTLKPYDLKSIYEMLGLDPYAVNAHWNTCNIDMLETQEKFISFYARDFNLGPECRTVWDYGFNRENFLLGENDYQEYLNFVGNGNIPEMTKALIETAFSKLGTTYSQAHRNEEGYYDCSSFVAACYRQIGIDFGGYSPVAADICKYLEKSSHQVSTGYSGDVQPGDLLFYSSDSNGRYKNITHVALYVGNGKIIDASSSKGQVVYRNVWGKNEIVSVCRPLE